ncbi:MAG: DUF1570 domain-containing protein [Gammaproteobacteria bacterium]|nr:DUF1570 domain-containing protein [Gammaproteobacteria bacterium]
MRALILFLALIATALGARWYLEHPELWPRAPERVPVVTNALVDPPASAEEPEVAASPILVETPLATPPQSEFVFDRPCRAPPTAPIRQRRTTTIHRWVDERGQVHFADRAPRAAGATMYDAQVEPTTEYFSLDIQYLGQRTVPFLKDRLRAEVSRIYQYLADLLGPARLRQIELNVRIFDTRENYLVYATSVSPRLATTGGFYSHERNEAVTWRHASDAATLDVIRHEAIHVIAAGLLGGVPIWLNEGLAEYFEALDMEGMQARVPPQATWLALARKAAANQYPADLRDFLELSAPEWYDPAAQQVHYAVGWSLVYFLLDTEPGRAALTGYLAELADNYCAPVDQLAWFEFAYPNGLSGLAADYRAWLAGTRPAARYTHTHFL